MTHDREDFLDDAALDALLREARDDAPLPPAHLLARIEAQALALQPSPVPVAEPAPSLWDRLSGWLGSAAMPTGLTAAATAGLWLGYAGSDLVGLYGATAFDTEMGLRFIHDFPAIAGLLQGG